MRLLEPFARYKAAKYLMTKEGPSPGNVTDGRFGMGHPSHTRTVVRECYKGDDDSLWERGKFDPLLPKTP